MTIDIDFQPNTTPATPDPARSTDPDDYQNLPVAVAVMRKRFPSNFIIAPHSHRRDQLIYAASGSMRVRTETHSWLVPPERALYMPGDVVHTVEMRNDVEMQTLYIEPRANPELPRACAVIAPSMLLRELIDALSSEPVNYEKSNRGKALGYLVLDEICRGRTLNFSIPMPADPRLLKVCERVIDDPSASGALADYSDLAAASERTLARICRQELGMGFAAWRQQVRFHFALERLARGVAVSQVAYACGYASASAFTASFRKSFGLPPSRILDRAPAPGS
jgi:AraC-like DNA-binding protein/quercetin dioxygenase-like cupin family protein